MKKTFLVFSFVFLFFGTKAQRLFHQMEIGTGIMLNPQTEFFLNEETFHFSVPVFLLSTLEWEKIAINPSYSIFDKSVGGFLEYNSSVYLVCFKNTTFREWYYGAGLEKTFFKEQASIFAEIGGLNNLRKKFFFVGFSIPILYKIKK